MPVYEENIQRDNVRNKLIDCFEPLVAKHFQAPAQVWTATLSGEKFHFEQALTKALHESMPGIALNCMCAERDFDTYKRALLNKPDNCFLLHADIVELPVSPMYYALMWYDICGMVIRDQIRHMIEASNPVAALACFTLARNRQCGRLDYAKRQLEVPQAASVDDALKIAIYEEAMAHKKVAIQLGTIDFTSGTYKGQPNGRTPFRLHVYQVGMHTEPSVAPFGALNAIDME